MSARSDKPVRKTVIRQQFSHGRSKEVLVEIYGTPGKPKAAKPKASKLKLAKLSPAKLTPEKPKLGKAKKKIKPSGAIKNKARAKEERRQRRSSKSGHLFRFSEPMGPGSISYVVKIPASSDHYLLSAGMPGNEETDL